MPFGAPRTCGPACCGTISRRSPRIGRILRVAFLRRVSARITAAQLMRDGRYGEADARGRAGPASSQRLMAPRPGACSTRSGLRRARARLRVAPARPLARSARSTRRPLSVTRCQCAMRALCQRTNQERRTGRRRLRAPADCRDLAVCARWSIACSERQLDAGRSSDAGAPTHSGDRAFGLLVGACDLGRARAEPARADRGAPATRASTRVRRRRASDVAGTIRTTRERRRRARRDAS
jgi:hypothetical protein